MTNPRLERGSAMSTSEPNTTATPTFPMERTCPLAPPDEYQRMRATAPVVRAALPNGAPVWAVTRHAEARQILSDPRISSNTGRPERPRGPDDDRPDDGFFVDMDPPDNLDPASKAEVLAAVAAYRGAVVMVTHDQEAVAALRPDRVLLLPDGVEDLWNDGYADLITLA